MLLTSASSIVILSIPMPQPPVGGKPYSRAVMKASSTFIASSSPPALAAACSSNRSLCVTGSFSSVYALQTSRQLTNSSNRSVIPGMSRCHFASGLIA